ncbi:rod shape-determining protein MreD [Azospirillum sp. SYSU D00513]|uniref:rod shape-determining protein MreD n=1 Tax=Azospirillum sp. SYSU D00513 TaxID=2812561 RepID=UPI001A96FA0C|nr:rod shape-determining protein MreD [Azospirillum sp. SYSU D00513]
MTAGFWQRLDKTGRNLAPFAVTVMLVLVGLVPLQIPSYAVVAPQFALTAVFYWAIHRPDLMRPVTVFLIGLLQDLLSGGPLGLNALVLLLVHGIVLNQRRVFLASTFALMWVGFGMMVTGAALLQWAAYSLLSGTALPVWPALFQALMTLAFFPAIAWLLLRVHRAFLQG